MSSAGVSSLGQETSTPPEAGNEKEETPLQPFEQKHAEPAADVVKNLQSEVVPIEASDGLDDELEREMQRIIQGTDGLERDNHESKSIKLSGDAKTKLRERTNTIQNDQTADESRRDGEDGRHSKYVHITNDKENVSQGEVVSTVARRSSILQLIGDSNFDDDSDLDESSGEDDQAGSARMPVGNGKVSVRSEYRGAGNTDARKVISLENEYQTTAMDSLYNAREPHELQNGLADRHEPDPLNARVMSLDDSLEVTDVDDPFSRDTITRDFSAEPLAGTNESSNAHTMIDSIGSHNNTSHDGSSYAIQTGSFAMDTFVEQGNEVHTIETLEMGDTLGDGFESNQGGTDEVSMMETFDTMSTNRRPADLDSVPSSSVGATVMYDHEDKLADGAITEGGGTAIPIDTCDLTEEDKVWRSLTNQYASINSNGSIETNTIDTVSASETDIPIVVPSFSLTLSFNLGFSTTP